MVFHQAIELTMSASSNSNPLHVAFFTEWLARVRQGTKERCDVSRTLLLARPRAAGHKAGRCPFAPESRRDPRSVPYQPAPLGAALRRHVSVAQAGRLHHILLWLLDAATQQRSHSRAGSCVACGLRPEIAFTIGKEKW